MGPIKQIKVSRWQPLPDTASTLQVTTVYGFDDYTIKPQDLSKEDLENSIKFIEQSNRTLEVENTVIETYLLRMDPSNLLRMDQVLDATAFAMQKVDKTQLRTSFSPSNSLSSKRYYSVISDQIRSDAVMSFSQATMGNRLAMILMADKGPRVQPAHKIEIVNREIEELKTALEDFRQRTKHTHYILKCRNEELSNRLQEINDSRAYLEGKLVTEGTDPLTGRIPGEKFLRYLEMKLHSEESEIDKIRIKMSSTRNQLTRVEKQLAQKAELGQILHAVDFEQLKIENQCCRERLEEKILNLIEVKKISGRCGTILNFTLKKLHEQMAKLSELKKNIEAKQKMINQLKIDEEKVNVEVEKAKKSVMKIKNLMNTFSVPDVWDYIAEKSEMFDLKKEIKIHERQLKLKDLTLSGQAAKLRGKLEPNFNLSAARSSKKIFMHT